MNKQQIEKLVKLSDEIKIHAATIRNADKSHNLLLFADACIFLTWDSSYRLSAEKLLMMVDMKQPNVDKFMLKLFNILMEGN